MYLIFGITSSIGFYFYTIKRNYLEAYGQGQAQGHVFRAPSFAVLFSFFGVQKGGAPVWATSHVHNKRGCRDRARARYGSLNQIVIAAQYLRSPMGVSFKPFLVY